MCARGRKHTHSHWHTRACACMPEHAVLQCRGSSCEVIDVHARVHTRTCACAHRPKRAGTLAVILPKPLQPRHRQRGRNSHRSPNILCMQWTQDRMQWTHTTRAMDALSSHARPAVLTCQAAVLTCQARFPFARALPASPTKLVTGLLNT